MKKSVLFLILLFPAFLNIYGQSISEKENTVQNVFDKIVQAYGNAKAEPKLVILPENGNEWVVACFNSKPHPTIKIDEKLIDICMKLKDDSLNALAIVISHELAHYYNDHNFCVDYAYAASKKSKIGKDLLKLNTQDIKFRDESKADDEGIWRAAIAGYKPFGVFDKLIDNIYSAYKLSSSLKGYPTKDQRKDINTKSQETAAGLLPLFEAGIILSKVGEYEAAATCFDTVISAFPSREIYNNAGAAKLQAALALQGKSPIEFIYPVELDPSSRLYDNATRGQNDVNDKKRRNLLQMAYKHFDKAIFIDNHYTTAYINLACYYDLVGHYESAIGKLNEIPAEDTVLQINSINLVKGIAYYHNRDIKKAAECFNRLPISRGDLFKYNVEMFKFKDQTNNTAQIEKYKADWCKQNLRITNINTDQKNYFENYKQKNDACQDIEAEQKITICLSKDKTEMTIKIDDKKIFRSVSFTGSRNTTEMIVKLDDSWSKEHKQQKNTWFVVNL